MFSTSSSLNLLFFLLEGVILLYLTHFFRFYIKKHEWIKLSFPALIPRALLGATFLTILFFLMRILVGIPIGAIDLELAFKWSEIIGVNLFNIIPFFLWVVFYFSFHYFMQYNTSLKEKAEIHEIELNNLKSQLNPHFIFNSLNSIRALVDENPKVSKEAITKLSNILRNSLTREKNKLITFGEELKTVKDYLGLESVRYEERLKVKYEIDPGAKDYLIPPMMLQTLVENGIKHGISKLKRGGMLKISAHVENQKLKIEIRNTGYFSPSGNLNGAGLGIPNTKRRLEMIFGNEAKFHIQNEENGSVLTYLELPKSNQL